jgi:hypothetical protein
MGAATCFQKEGCTVRSSIVIGFLPLDLDFLCTLPGPTEPGHRSSHKHSQAPQRPADSGHIESDPFVEEIQSW